MDPPPSPTPGPPCPGNAGEEKLGEARKDRYCPPNRTPLQPVVLVATGDSITSAHLQFQNAFPMGACVGNTRADLRGLPGNDMLFSYAGKYAVNRDRRVVEYYNFARTGYGTQQILGAPAGYQDACRNPWARDWPPVELATRAIQQAKTDRKAAYFVSTGGVNNTTWTGLLKALASCGLMDHYRELMQTYFTEHKLPLQAQMDWFDLAGNYTAKSRVIQGGACHGKVVGDVTGIKYIHHRVEVPTWDGPALYPQIKSDVEEIVDEVLGAGADKVVWMGYYDISPARFDVGRLAEQYRVNLAQELHGYLPGQIPSQERDLIDDPGWKATVAQWTNQLNLVIRTGLPADNPKVRFAPAPALGVADLQKTAFGGSPHPNESGHDKLAAALDATFN
ncbi:hypothetical protein ACIA5A_19685 [Micromonospora sp. NPDC051300]|uniref:hypothetical protein n=1 Tax=Micromonospora sp. NPDC051300 TaxID=3364286 RepID=UPI0037A875E4